MDVEALGEVVGGGGVLLHDAAINSVNIGVGGFFACANVGHTAYQFFLDYGHKNEASNGVNVGWS